MPTYDYKCKNGRVVSIECNGTRSFHNITCPIRSHVEFQCTIPGTDTNITGMVIQYNFTQDQLDTYEKNTGGPPKVTNFDKFIKKGVDPNQFLE